MSREPLADAKRDLRRAMRRVRLAVADVEHRSRAIWRAVGVLPEVESAGVVMAFESVPGEPDSSSFIDWARAAGKRVVMPAPDREAAVPIDPSLVDVVIVPGLAFTQDGHRLGQGGGWYDRFLRAAGPDCTVIGVCFEPQVVESLPTEPHDVRMDLVVTDAGVRRSENR